MDKLYVGPIKEAKLAEKITLTKEQAEAIEQIKDKDYAINILALQKRPDHALATLEISQIAKLLYGLIEYEIEPEQPMYQPGEKIIRLTDGRMFTLKKKSEHFGNGWFTKEFTSLIAEYEFRKPTPEESYWMETLNRNTVKDFRIGDMYIDKDGRAELLEKDRHLQLAEIWYNDGDFIGVYPAESFKPFSRKGMPQIEQS